MDILAQERPKPRYANSIIVQNWSVKFVPSNTYNLRTRNPTKPFQVEQIIYKKNLELSNAQEFYSAKLEVNSGLVRVARHGLSSYEWMDSGVRDIGIWPTNLLNPEVIKGQAIDRSESL